MGTIETSTLRISCSRVFKIEPLPVSGLRVATGVTTVALSWKNNGTTTYWMLLEAMGNHKEGASISVRKPEVICKATLNVSESDNTERERGELQECASHLLAIKKKLIS